MVKEAILVGDSGQILTYLLTQGGLRPSYWGDSAQGQRIPTYYSRWIFDTKQLEHWNSKFASLIQIHKVCHCVFTSPSLCQSVNLLRVMYLHTLGLPFINSFTRMVSLETVMSFPLLKLKLTQSKTTVPKWKGTWSTGMLITCTCNSAFQHH